jgi:hypothetical protein
MEKKCGELTAEYKDLISILELIRIEEFIPSSRFNLGRPSRDRSAIARAYVAKIFLKYTNTKRFLKRLQIDNQLKMICGWDSHVKIPSESKFCRVFKEFAVFSLPEKVHQFLIKKMYENQIIHHLVFDSTPISAREKTIEKPSVEERKKIKNDRQRAERKGALNRRQKQLIQPLEESLKDLPDACDTGMKRSKGCSMSWDGYKLHMAVDDNSIPIAAILTSASLNDCEAAIPLCIKASYLTRNFYDLMDAAYDMPEIKENSIRLGHVPIIDKNSQNSKEKAERKLEIERRKLIRFTPADRKRYKARFPKERSNALLKDSYGGRNFLYRGILKISCHLMFGVLSMTAMMILKLSQ